ncbi:NAD-dependent succinate-semialdehyde dehydrogenase [Undibacter mobilis]|uniref:NAD-dependent succinate-semialdehyde dehydrogenase n=1 Tax=Undibacter mobilis TaxID=2292256 RepID=A0A371BAI8_9BRAD|nr:NAD-dependent succinate-semialdehyde dehydrogenase [Undibacter mobilis]RDV04552.1 NAD-dependent succinate-semialdehyde dehydrogenase [Undibacter mobilis]
MHDRLAFFIDGAWSQGDGQRSGPVLNPATGEEIGRVPFASLDDIDRALAAAERGFEVWKKVLPQERAKVIRKIATLLREQTDTIAAIMTAEQGKPIGEARIEVGATAELFEWLAEESRRIYGRLVPSRFANTRTMVVHEPIGPVAAFSPWNFPCMMPGRKIAHALAAGCSIVLKPAEETPGTAVALGKVCEQAGVPKGVVNILFGEPAQVSERLIKSPVIRKISLTGSTNVGRHIATLAARDFKKVTLELGGHAPVIVFEDADLDRAISLSVGSRFRNAGQVCTAGSRFFVQEALYDKFVAGFTAAASALQVGNGLDPKSQMGPLANVRRIDAMEKLVADAESRGGQVRTGGRRKGNTGFFFEPTVITGLTNEADLMNVEPFGPLAPIVPFQTFDQVVTEANRVPYGLAAYAFTRSQSYAARVGEQLQAGIIAINGVTVTAPEGPFGGMKDSGTGRESGIEGLLEHMNVKTITETYN